jgi:hypothetical protein
VKNAAPRPGHEIALSVMAGLDPAIHPASPKSSYED